MRLSRSTWILLLAAAGVTLVALLCYGPFRSASLDDFDSFNFARALVEFSPSRFQPHPPGYVLYVWLGRLALAITGDARLALTALSALSAGLACGLLFLTGSLLFNPRVGLIAVLLAFATPLMWLNAGKALSDATGLCAQAAGALLLALALRRRLPLWVAGVWIGMAAGFRPQGVIGLAVGWLLLAAWLRVSWRAWVAGALAVTAGALVWLLPTLAALQWNLEALRGYLGGAAGFVANEESIFATTLTLPSVAARLQSVWQWSSRAVFGPQPEWLLALLATGAFAFALCAFMVPRRHVRALSPGVNAPLESRLLGAWLCAAWFIPQALLQILFLNPELTRYLLALLFPSALLVALGLDTVVGRVSLARAAGAAAALVYCAVVGAAALPLAQALHTVPAPPDQLAAYLERRLPRGQTFVLARQSFNALAYDLPGWEVRFADAYDPATLPALLAGSGAAYVVVADPEAAQPGEQYAQVEAVQFARDPQVHAKHARVTANVYGLVASLSAEDFALPEDGIIRVGTPQDGKYLLEGWYRREDIGGVQARWTGSAESAALRVLLPPHETTLTLRAMSPLPGQTLALRCDDQFLFIVGVYEQWSEVSIPLPADCAHAGQPTRIAMRPSKTLVPAGGGASTDRRVLAIAVAEVRIR